GTTRNRATSDPGEMFDSNRAPVVAYASIVVSIPPDSARKIGEIQWPSAPPGDPARNFVTVSADYLDNQSFSGAVTAVAKQTRPTQDFLFVTRVNNHF